MRRHKVLDGRRPLRRVTPPTKSVAGDASEIASTASQCMALTAVLHSERNGWV